MDDNNVIANTTSGKNDGEIDVDVHHDNADELFSSMGSATSVTDDEFVTVEEVAESLRKKEEDSLYGSKLSGSNESISNFSDRFDNSLNALKEKKNQLIDSLRSVLADTSTLNIDISTTEDQMNSTATSLALDSTFEGRSNIKTSTPFPQKPLAARFLKNWKPSFINEEICEIDEIDTSEDENGYEKAMASLKAVLSDTSIDMASKFDSYSSMLDTFKQEDDKKYDEMISSITSDNSNLEECLENATKEVDEFIEEFSEKNIGIELLHSHNKSVVDIDNSKDCTLVALEETFTLSDTEATIKDVSKTPPIVVTIDSSQSDDDDTLTKSKKCEQSETSRIHVDSIKADASGNIIPKENDLEILIIGGDEDVDINIDDEDLLLASDDEGKLDKSENKKALPLIPLVKDLEVFISNDPDENKDNNDPKWNYLRNLGNDYDRYLAVRSRWKNIQIPNPKKDLTCRCRNPIQQINGFSVFTYNENKIINSFKNNNRPSRKRLHSPENEYKFSKRHRRESCTILFDRNIDQLAEDVRIARQNIFSEQEQALQQLADIQHMEKYVTQQKGGTLLDMKRLETKHMTDTRNCVEEFRRKLENLMEMARAKLTALQNASEEVRQFHEFYPNEDEKNGDTKSLVYLTEWEVKEILEVEDMLLSFPEFYNE